MNSQSNLYKLLKENYEKVISGDMEMKKFAEVAELSYNAAFLKKSNLDLNGIKSVLTEINIPIIEEKREEGIIILEAPIFDRFHPKGNFKDSEMPFSISVNPDKNRNFFEDPYFKIYNGRHSENSKNVTRVYMNRPEYEIHLDQKWILDSTEEKDLYKLLSKVEKKTGETYWNLIKKGRTVKITDEIPRYDLGIKFKK